MAQSNPLRIGTRGSRLALFQAELVRAALSRTGRNCEILAIKTTGDRIQDRPLADAGGKGLFTKELEEALLRNEIDLAVHSMKDVPTALPSGLMIGAILQREDPRDAFVSQKAESLTGLASGARVGTSSVRRTAQVLRERPDLQTGLLRGNVETRLRKLDAGEVDAVILAVAGLKRLALEGRVTKLLDPASWLPALGQGAIGIEIREADAGVRNALAPIDHAQTAHELACERAFQAALDGSCRTPIGGLARVAGARLSFRGEVLSPDGKESVPTSFECALRSSDPRADAERAGREAGLELRPKVLGWLA